MVNDPPSDKQVVSVDVDLFIEVIPRFGPLGKPAIKLHKTMSNKRDIQFILKKALNEEAIIAKIVLKNKYLALPKLAELGLVNPEDL